MLVEIEQRRTVNTFLTNPLSKDELDDILNAGRLAPSAKNRQPWRFVVVKKPATRERLAEASYGQSQILSAPVLVALCTTSVDYRMPNGQMSHPMDLSFAASFMIIQAQQLGLGSALVTTFDEEAVKAILNIPHSMRVVLLLALGKPENLREPSSRHSLKRIVGLEHW